MGLRDYYQDPAAAVRSVIFGSQSNIVTISPVLRSSRGYGLPGTQSVCSDQYRRERARRRLDIYNDNFENHLINLIYKLFVTEVANEVAQFAPLACANSLLKRIVNDIARGVYAIPPRRRFKGPNAVADEETHRALALEMDLDNQMDLATHLVEAVNDVLGFVRYIPDLNQMSLDLITPDQAFIIPHPRKPTASLAIGYEISADTATGSAKRWVVWDDTEYFEVDGNGFRISEYQMHGIGRKPFFEIHRTARHQAYWDETGGNDLEAATMAGSLVTALVFKLHKWQGEKTIAVLGTVGGDQTLDAGTIAQFNDADSIVPLDLVTPPDHYLKTKAEIETTIAANYGISRERLNQGKGGDDNALRERTSAIMRVMRRAEVDLFEILKVVSQQHPKYKLSADTLLSIDYPPVNSRVDRKEQLQIREMERSMGLSDPVKEYREDNWECESDEEAEEGLALGAQRFAKWIDLYRRLEIRTDGTSTTPGMDPRANGALGTMVREGEITGDEAAEISESGGKSDLRAIAQEVLRQTRAANTE